MTQIQSHLAQEKPLVFTSETQAPGTFAAVGTHRVAVTGNHVGDLIQINDDELAAFGYFDALAILTHEFGHHFGYTDNQERVLDIFGAKLKTYLLKTSEIVTLGRYQQPQMGVIIINGPTLALTETLGSELLIYDSEGIYDARDELNQNMPCPIGLTRKNSLVVSQLRERGLTDWLPRAKLQSAIFQFDIKQTCIGPKETYLTLGRVRMTNSLVTTSDQSQAGWWNTARATFGTALNLIIADQAFAPAQLGTSGQMGMPLEIMSLQNPSPQIHNGETWQVRATVRPTFKVPIKSCSALISSTDFVESAETIRFRFPFQKCDLHDRGDGSFDLTLSYKFPVTTPSREYYIDSIALEPKGSDTALSNSPDDIAQNHTVLTSTSLPKPITFLLGNLVSRDAAGRFTLIHNQMNPNETTHDVVPKSDFFGLTFYVQTEAPVRADSLLIGNYDWVMDGTNRYDDFDRPFQNSPGDVPWNFPFSGSTVVQPAPNQNGLFALQLGLRPQTHTKDGNYNELHSVQFTTLRIENENLQEAYVELDMTIEAK